MARLLSIGTMTEAISSWRGSVRLLEFRGLLRLAAHRGHDEPSVTAHGDVPMAVEAVKTGTFDFIEKPFDNADLRRAVAKASEQAIGNAEAKRLRDEARAALSNLTNREREVFMLVASGHRNKTIAHHLNIAIKTVEVHRSRVMEKLGATTLAQVIEIFRTAEKR